MTRIDVPGTAPRTSGSSAAKTARSSAWPCAIRRWVDGGAAGEVDEVHLDRIEWPRALPFLAMHASVLSVFWVGVSQTAIATAAALYALRMFALTGFYHRYFSHRTFQTSRFLQFVFAFVGASCAQRGPLWWAAHHRHHHRHADTVHDPHSPGVHGLLWSHAGWFLTARNFRTDLSRVPDLAKYPELRWLDRYDLAAPATLAVSTYAAGSVLQRIAPDLGTTGPQMLTWGFFVSTVALFHATVTINSLAHRFGTRRFQTRDDSRNNLWLALITFGEGWHNNHHYFPGSSRQGFRWWEVDLTWYGLKFLSMLGLVRDLKPVPAWVLAKARD